MNINAAIDIKVILHSVRALAPWRTRRRTSLGLVVGSSSAGARAGAGHHADGDGQGKKNKQGDKTRSSLRRFIDDECPQPSPITGKRVEASIYAGDGGSSQAQVEESLLLLRGEDGGDSDSDSGSILLPGARRNVKVKRKDWESYTDMKEEVVLACEKDLSMPRGSTSVKARVESTSSSSSVKDEDDIITLTLLGLERVVVESVHVISEVGDGADAGNEKNKNEQVTARVCMGRTRVLFDRWAYFVILRSIAQLECQPLEGEGEGEVSRTKKEEEEEAFLNCKDAFTTLMEAIDGLIRYNADDSNALNRWTRAKAFVLAANEETTQDVLEVEKVLALKPKDFLPYACRASFAAFQSEDISKHRRVMTTTDLGERMELAVECTKDKLTKAQLNYNFRNTC